MFPKGRKKRVEREKKIRPLLRTKVPACTEGATEEEEGITSSPLAYSLLIHAEASWNTSESNGEGQGRMSNRKEELYEEGEEYVDFYLLMLTSAINSPIG
ncbi:hypothetical protein V1478_008064 [Vespula squamosa]|uniref:Uncharacterized protein n=1 Tax=Vespula squamosa TaxID=30214 RepID=A0ABD2AYD3_VESSQ